MSTDANPKLTCPNLKGCRERKEVEKGGRTEREHGYLKDPKVSAKAQTKPDPSPWHDAKESGGEKDFSQRRSPGYSRRPSPPLWGEKEKAGRVGGLTCPNRKGCRERKRRRRERGRRRGHELPEGSESFS